ncbi:MAG: hypothetical protein JWR69_2225 [Pedosphaera sp.]|nr:hypothetical protein [Pedosphaera sp.]
MKTHIKRIRPSALIAGLGLMLAAPLTAQTFTTLHGFTASSGPYGTNSDGANPQAGLILSGNTLYGTAASGGGSGYGTVFAINTDGTGFTNLHSFAPQAEDGNNVATNIDGANPSAVLILSSNTLYGTAKFGGGSGKGTVFKVNTDGTGFTTLHSFPTTPNYPGPSTNSDGAYPYGGLVLSGNTLYGTAASGGSSGRGTVFAINTDGSTFTNLYSFTGDGFAPEAGLVISGTNFYGAARFGGSSGNGTVFKINTDGTEFTNLHSFTAESGAYLTNSDGANPQAGLILSGNTLYGTTKYGGSSGRGTAFRVNIDGTGFANLHNFTRDNYNVTTGASTNSDGADLRTGLIISGNALYGAAYGGGLSGKGTIFKVNTDGAGFTNLHSFPATSGGATNSEGAAPAGLTLAGNTLYGTTQYGGNSALGTVFRLSLAPRLAIIPSGTNVILTWPTNNAGFDYSGFTLQSSSNLMPSAVWSPVSPAPVVVSGQNAITNPISGAQKFYRLSQ